MRQGVFEGLFVAPEHLPGLALHAPRGQAVRRHQVDEVGEEVLAPQEEAAQGLPLLGEAVHVAAHQARRPLHHLLGEAEPKEACPGDLRPHLGVAQEAEAAHFGVKAAGEGLAHVVEEGGEAGLQGGLGPEPEEVVDRA